jgi:hypothetical protein
MNDLHRLALDLVFDRTRLCLSFLKGPLAAPRRLAVQLALIGAAVAAANPAAATTYFTGSGDSSFVFGAWNLSTGTFGFVYQYYDADTACGSTCMAVTTADGTSLGTSSLGIGGNYYFSNVGNGEPATLIAPSVYVEKLVPFGGGTGSVGLDLASGATLLNASVTGYSVYATPTMSDPVIEFDLTKPTSQVLGTLASTLYLDVTGTTTAPVTLSPFSGNPSGQNINGFTIDWTATLSDTPYSPTSGSPPPIVPDVPEPSTYGLLLAGLGVLGWAVRRRRTPAQSLLASLHRQQSK